MKTKFFVVSMLMLLAGAITSWADPVANLLPYQKKTTLAYPATYTFQFSLWNAAAGGASVWAEIKTVKVTSNTIKTSLGDTTPLDPTDFSQQLWIQVERKKADGSFIVIGTRDMLTPAPYALGLFPQQTNILRYDGQDSNSTVSFTYVLLRTVGSFTKVFADSDLELAWTGHGSMAGTGTFCDFQLRVDNTSENGSTGTTGFGVDGGGRAVLYTNQSPISVSAVFQGFAAGSHTVTIWVRGNATSCTLNGDNFPQTIIAKEIPAVTGVGVLTLGGSSEYEQSGQDECGDVY